MAEAFCGMDANQREDDGFSGTGKEGQMKQSIGPDNRKVGMA